MYFLSTIGIFLYQYTIANISYLYLIFFCIFYLYMTPHLYCIKIAQLIDSMSIYCATNLYFIPKLSIGLTLPVFKPCFFASMLGQVDEKTTLSYIYNPKQNKRILRLWTMPWKTSTKRAQNNGAHTVHISLQQKTP